MKWEMEVLSPPAASYHNWVMEESKNTNWTPQENKIFENALAVYDKDTPDRWHRVAAMIPGKTVGDVIKQYRELEDDVNNIEAGLIPIPGYTNSNSTTPFTLDWVNSNTYDGYRQSYSLGGKRSSGRPADQERKKGVPWTEEEHKLFLMGLKKYGKGDWRNISRNFVVTRTPTQVASHAQKYFIRQLSGGKDKRRASIHDITTVNLSEFRTPSLENNKQQRAPSSPDQSMVLLSQQSSGVGMPRTAQFQWNNQSNNGPATMGFNGNLFISSSATTTPYGINSYGLKTQNMHRGLVHPHHESSIGNPQSLAFQMQHYPHG